MLTAAKIFTPWKVIFFKIVNSSHLHQDLVLQDKQDSSLHPLFLNYSIYKFTNFNFQCLLLYRFTHISHYRFCFNAKVHTLQLEPDYIVDTILNVFMDYITGFM